MMTPGDESILPENKALNNLLQAASESDTESPDGPPQEHTESLAAATGRLDPRERELIRNECLRDHVSRAVLWAL